MSSTQSGSVLPGEDNRSTFECLQRSFRNAGFDATFASIQADADHSNQAQEFDVVVLDIELPDQPDIQCVSTSRLSSAHALVPVIVFVAKGFEPNPAGGGWPLEICEVLSRPCSEPGVIDAIIARVAGSEAKPAPQQPACALFIEASS